MENHHTGMSTRSKGLLWAINLMACADPGIIYRLSGQEQFLLLLIYRAVMPLIWGMLWTAFAVNFKKTLWSKETRKQSWTMMLSMLVLNVFSVSVALSRQGNLAIYSLILIGLYIGKILEKKLKYK